MTTLFLLRHAKALKAKAGMRDFDRPLEAGGKEDAQRLGSTIFEQFWQPERVLCSAALRTRQTLEGLGAIWVDGAVDYSEDLFDADARGYLELLKQSDTPSLLIVGHNPSISELAFDLAGDGDAHERARMAGGFPTCGLAVLESDGPLSELKPRSMVLTAYITPK
jgi:phosphohistidine phosphatase